MHIARWGEGIDLTWPSTLIPRDTNRRMFYYRSTCARKKSRRLLCHGTCSFSPLSPEVKYRRTVKDDGNKERLELDSWVGDVYD